ncbi:unnamed protein product [Clonostachys solani]|uniref:CHAT domain-containing protein n=1 Tax=Clonostachys solani TaxID=160281 RepID=A0A9N9ZMS7_9HYPO|nr:unnamed protein product [Clonostachys solani]
MSSSVVTPEESPQDSTPRTKKACDLCRNRKVKVSSISPTLPTGATPNTTADAPSSAGFWSLKRTARVAENWDSAARGTSPGGGEARSIGIDSHDRLHSASSNDQVRTPTPSPSPLAVSQAPVTVRETTSDKSKAPGRSVNAILELLGPLPLIQRVLSDWFKFVHPLAPVLHRQHLLHRMHTHGEDVDPVFAALVLSVCSVTVSTLRRKSFEQYPAITVEKCIGIIEDENLLLPQPYTLDWCITWYNIASALLVDHGPEDFRVYRAIKEAMASVTYLLCFKGGDGHSEQDKEMLKRLYWFLFMWQVGAELRGQPHLTFLPFNQDLEHLRPKPILDRDLYPSSAPEGYAPNWPEDEIAYIPGLNSLIDIFLIWEKGKVDIATKPPEEVLTRAMERIQTALDGLRPELRWRGGLTRFPRGAWGHEVQMVNILITALSIKSNFLQHLGSLLPGITHQDIVSDVLEILNHLPEPVFETNGCAAVHKIRDIGSAYLAELRIGSGVVVGDNQAQEKVYQLLNKLDSLDFRPYAESVEIPIASNESHSQTGALGNLRGFDDNVEALQGVVQADCCRGPEWITSAAALVGLYHTKFALTRESRYLSLAISLGEECAISMTSNQAGRFYHVANWMVDRYYLEENFFDLKNASSCIQKAFQAATRDHQIWNACLITNSRVLKAVYDHTMDVADLEEAIKASRNAADSIKSGDTNRLAALTHLASLLQDWYLETRAISDLDESIKVGEEILSLMPSDDQERLSYVNYLSLSIRNKALTTGLAQGLDKSISLLREVLAVATGSTFTKRKCLGNLAMFLYDRYNMKKSPGDLDESIQISKEEVKALSADDPMLAVSLMNLRLRLDSKYFEEKNVENARDLVIATRRTINIIPKGSPDYTDLLIDLGSELYRLQSLTGQRSDLEEAIHALKKTQKLEHHHTPKATRLNFLCDLFHKRFLQRGQMSDILEAIQAGRRSINNTSKDDPMLPDRLFSLGCVYHDLYRRYRNNKGFETAIQLAREAIDTTPKADSKRFQFQSTLAHWLGREYSVGDSLHALNGAIELGSESVGSISTGHSDGTFCTEALADLLSHRSQLEGNDKDLDNSISLAQEAAGSTALGHPDRPSRLLRVGMLLYWRYNESGDIGSLESAIQFLREARKEAPDLSDNQAEASAQLSSLLATRYDRIGESSDLREASGLISESINATPQGHSLMPERLMIKANIAFIQFSNTWKREDVEEAINLGQQAVSSNSQHGSSRRWMIATLSGFLINKSFITQDVSDINIAIQLQRDALKGLSIHDREFPGFATNLASCLSRRSRHVSNAEDLNESIQLSRDALSGINPSDPQRGGYLFNLGSHLHSRYLKLGGIADLVEAISFGQAAIEENNSGIRPRAQCLTHLSEWTGHLYERTNDVLDLRKAVDLAQKGVNMTREGQYEMSFRLNILTQKLYELYRITNLESDLHEAVVMARKGIQQATENSRMTSLNLMGAILISRYDGTKNVIDLDSAIDHIRKAIDVAWKEQTPGYLINLAVACQKKYMHGHQKEALDECVGCLKAAIRHTDISLVLKLYAQRELLKVFADNLRWEEALEVAESAVYIIRPLLFGSFESFDRQHLLRHVSGLGCEAASVALGSRKGEAAALHFLEQCRGVLTTSVHDMRKRIPELERELPELAQRLFEVKQLLNKVGIGKQGDQVQHFSFSEQSTDKIFDEVLSDIRKHPKFDNFLLPPTESMMKTAARDGPIVVVNASVIRCDAIIIERCQIRSIPLPELEMEVITSKAQMDLGSTPVLEWLWDTIAHPVFDAIGLNERLKTDGNWPHIWWIPTGPLSRFPLHAAGYHLQCPSETVIDRVISSYSSSVRMLITGSDSPPIALPVAKAALLVTMENTPGCSRLPFALQETQEVRKICMGMNLTILEPKPFRQDVLTNLMSCNIFHFAGHGRVNLNDPSKSQLLLKDYESNPLTVANIIELDLNKTRPFLAYLSACGTARSRNEQLIDESIHLIAAFKTAGFRHAVGSLWEINDDTSANMAKGLYEELGNGMMSDAAVANALHNTTRKLRDQWVHSMTKSTYSRTTRIIDHEELPRDMELDEDNFGGLSWVPYVHFGP